MNRYNRQTLLPEVGETGQSSIRAAHVLVVGAGGLAASALQYLVGAGVGQLTLIDGDVVALSNLHRQTLFRETDIGKSKASAAAENLHGLNSETAIHTFEIPLDATNAYQLVTQCTLVLDCADSFAVSYILSDTCKALNVPLISASVLGFSGYVGGFCADAPSIRAVFPDLPDRAATCATAGVMGPVVGMIGAAQAQMALGCLIGQSPSPLGQLIYIDMRTFRTSGFRFDHAPDPEPDLTFIAASDLTPDDFVVELRGVDEAPDPITTHAQRFTIAQFTTQTNEPRSGQRAVFACKSGLRAWQAASHLRSYWAGDISLIAMGDTPPLERSKT